MFVLLLWEVIVHEDGRRCWHLEGMSGQRAQGDERGVGSTAGMSHGW